MKTVELNIRANVRAYLPDGSRDGARWVESWFVRAKTKKRAREILNERTNGVWSDSYLRNFALSWGDGVIFEEPETKDAVEGIWFTRSHWEKDLTALWVDGKQYREKP
jgi:hypothetical protein